MVGTIRGMTVADRLPDTLLPAAARTPEAPAWRSLAGLMLGSGVLHLVMPKPYESIVPKVFGDPKPLVFWSGVAEIGCGVGLAVPRTRRLAGLATAALLLGVYPANLDMTRKALRSSKAPLWWKAGTVARLPLQAPPLVRAWQLARAPRPGSAAAQDRG